MPQAFGGSIITDASQIANGIITNAHINASAAIASTKISGMVEFLKSLQAGEAIAAYEGICLGDDSQTQDLLTIGSDDSNASIGYSAAVEKSYQTITGADVAGVVKKITLKIAKVGTPTDNLVVEIRQSTVGGTLLATASKAGSELTTTPTDYALTLNNTVNMQSGTTYVVLIYRDTGNDSSNYYNVRMSGANPYAGGSRWNYSGSWSEQATQDIRIILTKLYESGKIYQSKTTTAGLAALVSGIAPAAIALGASGNIQVSGIITNTGWSWTPGKIVYATDTAGALSQTAGTQSRAIGRAISATEIAIDIV